MLKLKVKPTGSLGVQEVQCYNVMVSPDLSHISGRTSDYNGLLNGENVKVVNNENKTISLCKVDTKNVKVQGKVAFDVTLPIKTVTKGLLLPPTTESLKYKLTEVTKKYVEYNGSFSYEYNNSYLIDGKVYNVESSANTVTISTFSYIEDGYVDICGEKFVVDFRGGDGKPDIKKTIYSDALKEGDKMLPSTAIFKGAYQYSPDKWKRETKFNIWKNENDKLTVDTVLYGGYEHYIDYKGERYYLKPLYSGTSYCGYGVDIDGIPYSGVSRNIYDGDENVGYFDEPFNGSVIGISGDVCEIQDYLVSHSDGGAFVFIVTKSENLNLKPDDFIIAKSNGGVRTKLIVQLGLNGERYVLYNDKRYNVLDSGYTYINAYDNEYRIFDDSYSIINGNVVYFNVSGNAATPTNKIYYSKNSGRTVDYGISEVPYTIYSHDAVEINGVLYPVYSDGIDYVEINDDISFKLWVSEKNGSSTYVCRPYVESYETDNSEDIARIQRYICDMIVLNSDNFSFQILNTVFGDKQIYPDTYLYEAAISAKPICTSEFLNLSIFKVNSYINFDLPIVNSTLSSVLKDDMAKNDFTEVTKSNATTGVVDMEKDIYYPVWNNGGTYEPIKNIRFNLHFRTRQLDNWKVVEDYVEDDMSKTNWFITDYDYYQDSQTIGGEGNPTLQNASDLVGFMNFTLSDVKEASKKISKSFLRLSFFSTDNPQTQVLLGTSTIFMDANGLCDKAFTNQKGQSDGAFIRTKFYSGLNSISSVSSTSITDDSEYAIKATDGSIIPNFMLNETEPMRLSSRFNVYDKYTTTGSSEGFYFYMYKEYSTNLRPTRMYMKVDFNHAGIGKSIPFMLPRRFDCNSPDGCPLYLHKNNNLSILKQGFSLKDIYKQTYIPIDVIYDDSNKRYVYYLPDSLRENSELGVDDSIMEFNLFEVKFKDESKYENNQ